MSATVGRIYARAHLLRDFSHWRACIGEVVVPPVEYRIFIVQTAVQTLIKQSKTLCHFGWHVLWSEI